MPERHARSSSRWTGEPHALASSEPYALASGEPYALASGGSEIDAVHKKDPSPTLAAQNHERLQDLFHHLDNLRDMAPW